MNVEKFIKTRREEPTLYYCDRDVDLRPGVRYGPVIRDIYLVECCTSGRGSVIINGREFPFEAGSCCLLCPGDTITHTADTEYPRAGVWCAIDGLQVRTAFTQAGVSADEPFAPPEAFGEILENVQRMIDMTRITVRTIGTPPASTPFSALSSEALRAVRAMVG